MKIEIEVTDIDYEGIVAVLMPIIGESASEKSSLLGKFFGSKTQNAAQSIIRKIPPKKRDEWLASLINRNQAKITKAIEEEAAKNDVGIRVKNLKLKP